MTFERMNQSRAEEVGRQGAFAQWCAVLTMLLTAACTEHGITGPIPVPTGNTHPGFDTSIYPGDAAMAAWRKPSSPYEWVGYYLKAE